AFAALQRRFGARPARAGVGTNLAAKAADERARGAGRSAFAGQVRTAAALPSAALCAALWLLSEWLRGVVFPGFPWLAVGYSQTPPSPLAGYLPVVGAYGVGALAAFVAALVAFLPGAGAPLRQRWLPVGVVAVV